MSQISNADILNLFKKVYGDLQQLLPEDYLLAKDIPFSEKQKVGEKYVEGVVLTNETGITFGGSAADAFELNPAIAGAVQQAEIAPYMSVLGSVIPWGVMSRAAGGGEKAFFDATKHVVKNNLRSHGKFLEIVRLYGQSPDLLGYVSYATATYRGVAFTNGTGTLDSSVTGGSIAFTNGINTSEQAILVSPGQFAAGIWVGMEGVIVQQVDASNNVVKEGKLRKVDAQQGILFVDYVPTAASSTTSHRLCFKGMASSKEAMGIHSILTATGNLFGIPTSEYALWKGNSLTLQSTKFTLEKYQTGVAAAVNTGGLEGDLCTYVNPRTWATMVATEAGSRQYDHSYKPGEAENGFESIKFYSQNGMSEIKAHRMVKEGHAISLHLPDWSRSGSAEVSFKVPGIDKEVIFPLENQAAHMFRSFSDQYIFNHAPAKSIYWSGINDEASS